MKHTFGIDWRSCLLAFIVPWLIYSQSYKGGHRVVEGNIKLRQYRSSFFRLFLLHW